jgi:prepilin-type N-terminal cleavage/methylation domain-containing protein
MCPPRLIPRLAAMTMNCRGPGLALECPDDERVAAQRGFTLIEAMIVVAIVVILAAIALPGYRDYIVRGKLAEGTHALAGLRARMEQYHQDNRTYLTVSPAIVSPCDASIAAGTFTLACPTLSPTAYQLAATGSGVTHGFVFTTDTQGNQATLRVPGGWGTAAPYACWITRRGDC